MGWMTAFTLPCVFITSGAAPPCCVQVLRYSVAQREPHLWTGDHLGLLVSCGARGHMSAANIGKPTESRQM